MSHKYGMWIIVACIMMFTVSCQNSNVTKLKTIDIMVGTVTVSAEVARTSSERATGLMYRKQLGEKEGMLFVYEREQRLAFYMRNTYVPLSIAFIAADGTIRQIEDMEPLDESTVESHYSVRYALEVNQGAFARWGVTPGDRIVFPDSF
ncbi:MAG TPA: DUF192 domain-containing protein [Spirochaetia bacterium]|nr:DUF192 domain-containing protein [Spirochaetia bacterium]